MNAKGVILKAFEQFRLKTCIDFRPRRWWFEQHWINLKWSIGYAIFGCTIQHMTYITTWHFSYHICYHILLYGSSECSKKFCWFEWATPTFGGLIFLFIIRLFRMFQTCSKHAVRPVGIYFWIMTSGQYIIPYIFTAAHLGPFRRVWIYFSIMTGRLYIIP